MKKQAMCVFLCVAFLFSMSSTAFAVDEPIHDSAFTSYHSNTAKESVSADAVNMIIEAHTQPSTRTIGSLSLPSESELSNEAIDSELRHIYLDIDLAEKTFTSNPSAKNKAVLNALIERKDFLEATLTNRGFIFLSDDEANMLMGSSAQTASITGAPTPPTPTDTVNTRYVMSELKVINLDDTPLYWYYVTAYAKTVNSSMVSMPIIAMDADETQFYLSALIETYIGKFVSELLSYSKIISWAPYEMIGASPDLEAPCSYTIDAVYTTTPRFVWLYSEPHNTYYLEGILHTTNIEDHHVMRYTSNGFSEVESHDENYTYVSPKYNRPVNVIKNQWNSGATTTYIEFVQDVKYYFQPDEDNENTKELVATKVAPYAYATYCMN